MELPVSNTFELLQYANDKMRLAQSLEQQTALLQVIATLHLAVYTHQVQQQLTYSLNRLE